MHGETLINPNKVGGIYDVLDVDPVADAPEPLLHW